MILVIDSTEHKNNYNDFFDNLIYNLNTFFEKDKLPSVSKIKKEGADHFKILISTIISARTKDEITYKATEKLFSKAKNAKEILKLSENEIAKLIYPAGFYKVKAKNIKKTSEIIVKEYNNNVPNNLDDLLKLPGVGRKTANLVLAVGFKKEGLCVDTHVHRISNRLGIIKTKNPTESEMALRKILPKKYWEKYNELLVLLGQNVCHSRKPLCQKCPVSNLCKKII